MTRQNNPPPEGISDEQRSALDAYVNELSQLGGPPPEAPPEKPPPVTDDEWGKMTDRQRENWVATEVGWNLQQLAKLDADRQRDADIQALKDKKPEPEGTPAGQMPTMLQRLQKFLWGEPDK